MGDHNTFGKLGEQKAIDFLKASGYQIVRQNYRYLRPKSTLSQGKGIS